MSEEYINNIQRIAYSNAKRRGFYGDGYTSRDAHRHLKSEVIELGEALAQGDKEQIALESGDVILLAMCILFDEGIEAFDAITQTLSKELAKKSG